MAERAANQILENLKDQNQSIYSFSRLDAINNCLYDAYQSYVLNERGEGNIYSFAGSKVHDKLEELMNGTATEADLLPAVMTELEDLAMAGIEFPVDANGNETLKNNWVKDMEHFCKTYKKPKGTYTTEEFCIYKSKEDNYIQGYIDLIRKNEDGSISIYDYKTSSLYTGEAIKEHGRQLLLYAMAKMQQGIKVEKVGWIFLKYCEVRYIGKKTARSKEKTEISKVFERRKVGTEMAKIIRADLEDIGFDDLDINPIIEELKETNTFDHLPEQIKNNYKLLPYVCEYEITDEAIEEVENYINNTIKAWEALSDKEEYIPRKFTRLQKNGKEVLDTFFCTALCNHKKCKYVTAFLEEYHDDKSEEEDMFK